MPGKMKGKKKGKKHGKHSSKKAAKTSSSSASTTAILYRPPVLRPGEKLLDFLTTHPVNEKEVVHGVKVSTRVLEQLTPQEIRDLHLVFELFDKNSDGFIGSTDLRGALRTLGFKLNKEDSMRMMKEANIKSKNEVDFNEFLEIIIDRQGDTRDTYDEIIKGFQMFDFDGEGSITLDKLKRACTLAEIKFTQKELEEMIEEADLDGNGCVDQSEFIQIMLQTNLF